MKKYKIKLDKEPLSESDISNNMNFDKFYSGYSAASKASWLTKSMKTFLGGTTAAALVVAATFVIYKSTNDKVSVASHAFIDPPMPELNSNADNFIVDNTKDTTIVYRTGSIIHVPANVFKSKDGKEPKGKVKVSYREFHDQVDFIFSGIPMDYDSAGIKRPLESAGMFEVLAYENDSTPLLLKDRKTLTVSLLSENDENSFNVYYLDTVAKRWDFKEHETRVHKEDLDKLSKEKEAFLAKHNLLDPRKLITPKRANPSLSNFMIDYDKEEFPELAVYDGVKFEVNANEPNYNNGFTKTVWEDVFISRHPDGKSYILTFKLKKQTSSIAATPVFDEKNFTAAMKEYEKIRLHHSQILAAKSDSISKLEKTFDVDASRSNNINDRFNAYVESGSVYRSIIVGTTGIWNWDRPINNEVIYAAKNNKLINQEPNYYGERKKDDLPTAYFVSEETGKRISLRGVNFMKRDINAIYPVGLNDITQFPVSIISKSDILIVIANDFKVYYLKDEKLHETILSGKEITFKLKEIDCSEKKDGQNINGSISMSANLDKIKSIIDL
ncbi:MAG TPA: hypothetical protein VN026_02360 [Bacteroidia bacterium]|jgi:hypothetical protein|nr:hypothetical protein [Bacteroidia bacterium]